MGPGISCGARKLARTPRVTKKKKKKKEPWQLPLEGNHCLAWDPRIASLYPHSVLALPAAITFLLGIGTNESKGKGGVLIN